MLTQKLARIVGRAVAKAMSGWMGGATGASQMKRETTRVVETAAAERRATEERDGQATQQQGLPV